MKTSHNLERVRDGELAFHLQEYDEMNGSLAVRWQEIMVLHDGQPCTHIEPLGPAAAYTCMPFKVLATVMTDRKIEPAGDTAGDLRDHANRFRESGFMEQVMDDKQDSSTLLEDFYKFKEMKRALLKSRSRTINSLKGYAT